MQDHQVIVAVDRLRRSRLGHTLRRGLRIDRHPLTHGQQLTAQLRALRPDKDGARSNQLRDFGFFPLQALD